jgi:hypothetical protein
VRRWALDDASRTGVYASADIVCLLDIRDSAARVAWEGGAAKSLPPVPRGGIHPKWPNRHAKSSISASRDPLELIGVAFEAPVAYRECVWCLQIHGRT